jgi:hypothetical protein
VIFNNTNIMFIEFVTCDAVATGRLSAAIRRENRTLIDAISM